jgi:aryl-alcohol dehydrogenase-like predicted oxidoreductase
LGERVVESKMVTDLNHLEGLQLGLGLVSIGRIWGVANTSIPSDVDAASLLSAAINAGISIFDTAPAYAVSEKRLGSYLKILTSEMRSHLSILTKMGEHWDDHRNLSFVDHSRDALCKSIDHSQALLGKISLLQLHKASENVVAHPDTLAAIDYARTCGITNFGASVTSIEAAEIALSTGYYSALQFPFNATSRMLEPLLPKLAKMNILPIINRPFGMGATVHNADDKRLAGTTAFKFLKNKIKRGIILTGTSNAAHVIENAEMFRIATNYSQ